MSAGTILIALETRTNVPWVEDVAFWDQVLGRAQDLTGYTAKLALSPRAGNVGGTTLQISTSDYMAVVGNIVQIRVPTLTMAGMPPMEYALEMHLIPPLPGYEEDVLSGVLRINQGAVT